LNVAKEIIKSIQIIMDREIDNQKTDRTFASVITQVHTNNTYTVLAQDGSEREIYSCLPSLSLNTGTKVWVKLPSGSINNMHICGIRQ